MDSDAKWFLILAIIFVVTFYGAGLIGTFYPMFGVHISDDTAIDICQN